MDTSASRLLVAAGLAAVAVTTAGSGRAHASPNHAHHHYHMGVRAYAGTRHAAMLYQEAGSESCDPILARENAADMERLAAEIWSRGRRLEAVLSERETRLIGADVARMQALALRARLLAAELGAWIDEAMLGGEASEVTAAEITAALPPELQSRVAARSRELFACFKDLLTTHKTAERKLDIPVPPDPPDLEN